MEIKKSGKGAVWINERIYLRVEELLKKLKEKGDIRYNTLKHFINLAVDKKVKSEEKSLVDEQDKKPL